jgi:hypothetical protein
VLSWLKIIPFLILAPVCAICQVQVTVPAQGFKASERIAAKVANVGDHEILYCVEVGQTSFKGAGVENTGTTPTARSESCLSFAPVGRRVSWHSYSGRRAVS